MIKNSNKKNITILVICISVLTVFVSVIGIFSSQPIDMVEFQNIFGDWIALYGKGIYAYDSVSTASQGIASDIITLFVMVPALIFALVLYRKDRFIGKILMLGLSGYFLYTYMSYTFLWMYNQLFIIYVMLMSMSLFLLIMSFTSIDQTTIQSQFKDTLPRRFLSNYQIFIGVMIGLLWLGKIFPTLMERVTPEGLDHYTTLVIQAMDLGFLVPVALLSAIKLRKKQPLGYLLTSLVGVKGFAMLLSISLMIVNMLLHGVEVSIVELILFPLMLLLSLYAMITLIKNMKRKENIIV